MAEEAAANTVFEPRPCAELGAAIDLQIKFCVHSKESGVISISTLSVLHPRNKVPDRCDAACAFHFFLGHGRGVLDAGEAEPEFVRICRAVQSFFERDKS